MLEVSYVQRLISDLHDMREISDEIDSELSLRLEQSEQSLNMGLSARGYSPHDVDERTVSLHEQLYLLRLCRDHGELLSDAGFEVMTRLIAKDPDARDPLTASMKKWQEARLAAQAAAREG
jgi:hypothetical protein